MSPAGDLGEMTERQILYRLVGDVEGLKKEADNGAKSREITREQMTALHKDVTDLSRKLDQALGQDERLRDCEKGVSDYRKTKARVLHTIVGFGVGAGGLGGAVATALSKWLGGAGGA